MDKILSDWFYVIKNCSVDNTYKMGWCKSIIECCLDNNPSKEISFDRISQKMFKYYWNQTIFFNLQQSPNPNKPPEFISYVKKKIDLYQKQPAWCAIELLIVFQWDSTNSRQVLVRGPANQPRWVEA